ncbi:MAG: Mur ligase family protein, partial [Gemmatimonadota bacterium]
MRLSELLRVLPEAEVRGPTEVEVSSVECDSRRTGPGALFVAIRGGQERDRHQFIGDAVARGAVGVVVEEPVAVGRLTCICVPDARLALARLAAQLQRHPAEQLSLVGVTGTNGKTTTALIVRSVLEAAGRPCAYMGTLGLLLGGQWHAQPNTTPEAGDLHAALRACVDGGARSVAMEVSSHALALDRVAGIRYEAAVFTNLSRDHLDFHGTEARYFEAKARLFERLKEGGGRRAIINRDDGRAAELLARVGDRAL